MLLLQDIELDSEAASLPFYDGVHLFHKTNVRVLRVGPQTMPINSCPDGSSRVLA